MKWRIFATVLVMMLVLALGILVGMTPAVSADVPPVAPTTPGKGTTNVPCEEDADCVLLNYRWNTPEHPCCLYDNEGNEINELCERCWEKYFREHSCDLKQGVCVYEDWLYTVFIHYPCYWCPVDTVCHAGACLPEPATWSTATADVSVEVHALILIDGVCREVGLDGLGIRLAACGQPELQTSGEGGEAHWSFWPNWGDGTHQIEWWNGDAGLWQSLLSDDGKPVTFRGSQLKAGKTLHLGPIILWNTCR